MRPIDADTAKNKYFAAIEELLKATTTNLSDDAISLLAGSSIIDNTPTLDVHKWVSVHDRLPEADCYVLVYGIRKIDGFIGKTQIAITCMRDTNPFDYRQKTEPYWLAPWKYFLTDYEITHWQYLPEPPKEDDNGK